MKKMYEWNVYIDGKYVGIVQAYDEKDARCSALHKFEVDENASISVNKR